MALREHPPTFVGIATAFLASLVSDVSALIPPDFFLDPLTVNLFLYAVAGVIGGAIGKFAERYTIPFTPVPEGDGPDPDPGPEDRVQPTEDKPYSLALDPERHDSLVRQWDKEPWA